MTNSLFPRLLDTKHMASITPLKDIISNTSLGEMDKCLSKDPFPSVKIVCKEYDVINQKLHEAGYDAFLTGYCYVRMLHYLEAFNSSKSACSGPGSQTSDPKRPLVTKSSSIR